jgi:hypothetical protein
MKHFLHVALALILVTAASAQPRAANNAGAVAGRVTASAPAAKARVYLLYSAASPDDADDSNAGVVFLGRVIEVSEELAGHAGQNKGSESAECLRVLDLVDRVLSDTLRWAEEKKQAGQIVSTVADEKGNFKLSGVPAGFYLVVVRGRAGDDDAYWSADLVVEPGGAATLQLSTPEKSCPVAHR